MKFHILLKRWIIYCLLLTVYEPGTIILAQTNIRENKVEHDPGWLGIELSFRNTNVNIKDSITFDVKLVNIGKEKLTIFNQLEWGHWAGLLMMITDEKGYEVLSEIYDDYLTIPTDVFKSSSYIALYPGHYLGVTRLDTAKNLFRKPGKYSVTVTYLSPAFESSVEEDTGAEIKDLWGRERVRIAPSTVWIEVTGD